MGAVGREPLDAWVQEALAVVVEDLGVGVVVAVGGVARDGQIEPAVMVEVARLGVVGGVANQSGAPPWRKAVLAASVEIVR